MFATGRHKFARVVKYAGEWIRHGVSGDLISDESLCNYLFRTHVMRIWSLHPSYLDTKGLVALWRECLLAQKVLLGQTKGYRNHPQLIRFRNTSNPIGAVASYLRYIVGEADSRGYHFDKNKIVNKRIKGKIPVTRGQVEYELKHLLAKLKTRDTDRYHRINRIRNIEIHPLFEPVDGDIEEWEIVPAVTSIVDELSSGIPSLPGD